MLQALTLLLPALVPSWRFFDTIAPSPRIEFCLLTTPQDNALHWQEYRPRPAQITIRTMLKRMIWNPYWNESLFLVSCAEQIMEHQSKHHEQEINIRIITDLQRSTVDITATPYVQFRLIFLSRQGTDIQKHITYISPPHHCAESPAP